MTPIEFCLASRLYYPFYAGGALRFKRYLPGLRVRNVHTRVFTGTPSLKRMEAFGAEVTWQDAPTGKLMPVKTINDVPVHRVRLPNKGTRWRDIQYSWQLVKFCQQASYKPDLVQFLPLQLWFIPALLQLRRLKIPTIAVYNLLEKRPSNSTAHLLQNFYWRLPFKLVDCILVNSRFMRESLHSKGVTTRIEVIPNGVNINRFHPETEGRNRQKIRRALGIGSEENLIITVGSVEPRKGTDLLLEAWSQLARSNRPCHLLIVGPRPDRQSPAFTQFHQKLKELITASGISEKVHFVGQVDNVEEYLQAADVFVFTSHREGLPNVVLEAMATALPVVMTPFIGLSNELGQADRHYRLAERTPLALADSIQQLIDDQESRQLLGKTARQWVKTEMDVERSLDQLSALYASLSRSNRLPNYSHQASFKGEV